MDGVGKINANYILCLTKCTQHGRIIRNKVFRQKDQQKTTWKHPRLQKWHFLDYVIVHASDRREILFTTAMKGFEDCWMTTSCT